MGRKYRVFSLKNVYNIKSRSFYGNPYYAQLSRWSFKNLLSHARTVGPIPPTLSKSTFGQRKTQMRRVMSCSRGDNSHIVKIHWSTTYKKNYSASFNLQHCLYNRHIFPFKIEQRGVFIIAHLCDAGHTSMMSSHKKDRCNLDSFKNGQGILEDLV